MFKDVSYENRAVEEKLWKITVVPGRQKTTLRMRIACWMTKATSTHPLCVKLIAFSLQKWLHERASMLRYTYIFCFCFFFKFDLHNQFYHKYYSIQRLAAHSAKTSDTLEHRGTPVESQFSIPPTENCRRGSTIK